MSRSQGRRRRRRAADARPLTWRLRNGTIAALIPGPALGPGIVTADPESVLAALEQLDLAMPWGVVRERVIPMFPRRRPLPLDVGEQPTVTLPPGLLVGFGIDLGPAVAFVSQEQVARWGIGQAELVSAALRNVRTRAAVIRPEDCSRTSLGGRSATAIKSRSGIAAALLLVPDELPRLLGPNPVVLVAPMRDLLIALPADIDPAEASGISEELANLDPNSLDLGCFRYQDGLVAFMEIGFAGPAPRVN